jgi:hypothetical protein
MGTPCLSVLLSVSKLQFQDLIRFLLRVHVETVKFVIPLRPRFDPGSGQVGFVVDKVALGQVFSEYFGFPCQSSFHQLLHNMTRPRTQTVAVGSQRLTA